MPVLSRAASLWRSLRHRSRVEDDLDEELRGYLEALAARKIAAGLDPASARREALRAIGCLDLVKDAVRDARAGHAVESMLRDVGFAWRGLRRAPGFTAVAVITLALGIGANTAIFSVVRAMLIAPLPFHDPSRRRGMGPAAFAGAAGRSLPDATRRPRHWSCCRLRSAWCCS